MLMTGVSSNLKTRQIIKSYITEGKFSKQVLMCAGGGNILSQCQHNPIKTAANDMFRVTDGGSLGCKCIAFVPPPSSTNHIYSIICHILYWADQTSQRMQSIAFPALFTGQ